MSDFYDFTTAILENKYLRLEYLTTAGPRLVRLFFQGSQNLLADAHDIFWDSPSGKYFPLGGHRLWISPELPEKTYIPDNVGLQEEKISNGVELTGKTETASGVRKSIRIELDPKHPIIHLIHTIINENTIPITIAPWAITQFRQGGTVLLPQPIGNTDPHGLLHNRLFAIWPYTRITDPRLVLRDDCILVHANPALPPIKLGYFNSPGWLAYWVDGILFRKILDVPQPGVIYPDGGCNTEVYCNDRFVELESLGSLATLAPGAITRLTETWELNAGLDIPFIPDEINGLLRKKN